jgi:hypothetical protein
VCHDSAFGIVVLGQFFNMFIISFASEYMMAGIGPSGVFFVFGGFSLAGGVYIWAFVKETRGLTDLQKKQLYKPVN